MKNNYYFRLQPQLIASFTLIFCLFIQGSILAQSSPTKIASDNTYGPGGTRETTVSKDEFGRDVTTELKYDASKKLRSKTVTTRHFDNSGTIRWDTVYYDNGNVKSTNEYEVNTDGTWKSSDKEYDNDGNVTDGEIRTKANGEFKTYEWDPKTKKFKGWDSPIASNIHDNKTKELFKCNPSGNFVGGYNFLSRDMGSERLAMHGANASITWFFRGSCATIPIGLKASVNTATKKNGEGTLSLSSIRVGPVADLTPKNEETKITIHVQLGVARDGYRILHDKSTATALAASAGASFDWVFSDKFGLRFTPETLLTRFNNQSQWDFIASTGIVYKIASKK